MTNFDYQSRLNKVASTLAMADADAVLITPGADLRYLTGYDALPLERLTCLALTSAGKATLFVPRLELPAAQVHQLDRYGIEVLAWDETDDPFGLVHSVIGPLRQILVSDQMWAQKVLAFQTVFASEVHAAGPLLSAVRSVKDSVEIEAIAAAGRAIDTVHNRVGDWLRPGRTEREVGRDIAEAIIDSGHSTVDFVIVASGPNGASPHHEVSDRVIQAGEPVVVDIGGTMSSGYCSDSTRVYSCGDPGAQYREAYEILKVAQSTTIATAHVGQTGAQVDAISRDILTEHALGEFFIHRTGHGLGLETHEEPYIVASNHVPLVTGNVFSVEPGFYIEGKYGARIEDIVALTESGLVNFNNTSHDLTIFE